MENRQRLAKNEGGLRLILFLVVFFCRHFECVLVSAWLVFQIGSIFYGIPSIATQLVSRIEPPLDWAFLTH